MVEKIKSVVFHWSESIVTTKTIDPQFKNIHDANYRVSFKEAQLLLSKAAKELQKLGRYSVESNLTVYYSNGNTRNLTVEITANKSSLTDFLH